MFNRGSTAGQTEQAIGDHVGPGIRLCLECDVYAAAVAGEGVVSPVDVPGHCSAYAENPDPRRGLRAHLRGRAEQEDAERVARRALRLVGKEGGHPTALRAHAEPAFSLANAQRTPLIWR
jgi:hypothetical protein